MKEYEKAIWRIAGTLENIYIQLTYIRKVLEENLGPQE
jgi:hypothetical protein